MAAAYRGAAPEYTTRSSSIIDMAVVGISVGLLEIARATHRGLQMCIAVCMTRLLSSTLIAWMASSRMGRFNSMAAFFTTQLCFNSLLELELQALGTYFQASGLTKTYSGCTQEAPWMTYQRFDHLDPTVIGRFIAYPVSDFQYTRSSVQSTTADPLAEPRPTCAWSSPTSPHPATHGAKRPDQIQPRIGRKRQVCKPGYSRRHPHALELGLDGPLHRDDGYDSQDALTPNSHLRMW